MSNLLPQQTIVIDLDLRDADGNKNAGLHLHYIYNGDVSALSALYAPGEDLRED